MTGHTSGPWRMTGSTIYALNSQNPPCNKFYATVQRGADDSGRYICDLEVIANANLITAAPDLLEALEALLADAPSSGLTSIYLARNAIAKAKGLTSS